MKKQPSFAHAVLAVLLCQVLAVTQVFAIAGGPPIGSGFTGGGTTSLDLNGTYSGVLLGLTEVIPDDDGTSSPPPIPGDTVTDPADDGDDDTATTAIGLFDLGVTATTGLATGTFLVFTGGRIFTGTIAGAVDPGTGSLRGILQAGFDFTLQTLDSTGALVSIPISASASGRLDTAISGASATTTSPNPGGLTTGAANTLVTLSGTATLDISFGLINTDTFEPVIGRRLTFSVSGFRNSQTVELTGFTAAAIGG